MKAIMYCMWVMVPILIGSASGGACSFPDPGDMSALEAEIAKQPETTRDKMNVGVVTLRLRDQRPTSQAIEVYCREPNGPWEGMYDHKGFVADIVMCIFLGGKYQECGEQTGKILVDLAQQSFANVGKTMDCKWQWLAKFDPAKVEIDSGALWLIGLPAAPAEFAPQELAPLMPFLCPLDVSWGCPPRPSDIGAGNGASSTGDFK